LRESKDLLSLAMAGMSDGFAMFDQSGTIVFTNDQYAALFPLWGDMRVPGKNIRDILRKAIETNERRNFPAEVTDEWLSNAAASLHYDKDEHIELFNGAWLSLRTRQASNGMALVAVSDITVLKQAEFSLRTVAEQMKPRRHRWPDRPGKQARLRRSPVGRNGGGRAPWPAYSAAADRCRSVQGLQ